MSYKWHHNFPKIAREAGFMIRELSIGHCIDWRFVASIDPYNIVSEQDYEKLDEFIPHISEVPIGTVLNNRILDPAIGKYFILAQFSIQYLLFCKQFLDETVVEIRSALQGLHNENARLEKMNKKRNEETILLQKKLQRVEHISSHQPQQTIVFPCTKCTKNFISAELMQAHMVRKHSSPRPHANPDIKSSNTDTNLINTIKLELEVKQLKERLNVAEKDLLNQRSKHHRCHACSDAINIVQEEQKIKIVHSIGIQSNLTDDKDSNEKEIHTQTESLSTSHADANLSPSTIQPAQHDGAISKSDLQCLIEEQKRLFESWKNGERQKFNVELETVKQNLVEAISMMQTTEKILPSRVSDDVVWKERYQELEKMFANSQQQTKDTMMTFELAYTTKMEHLETLLAKMVHLDGTAGPPKKTDVTEANPFPIKSIQLRTVTLPEIVIEGEPGKDSALSKSSLDKTDIQNNISSSEFESTQSEDEPQKQEPLKVLNMVSSLKDIPSQVKPKQTSPRKHILNQFRARLKMIGIDSKSKQLSGEDLHDACEVLASRRDSLKKKYKHFFITRNQLLSKVDEMARAQSNVPPNAANIHKTHTPDDKSNLSNRENKLASNSKVLAGVDRLRSSPTFELLPSMHARHFPGKSTTPISDMPIFKTKAATPSSMASASRPIIKLTGDDIITVHAELQPVSSKTIYPPLKNQNGTNKPNFSKYDEQIEKLLDTPIKTLSTFVQQDQQIIGDEEKNSDFSEMLDTAPAQPKPIPKKRVLFNLEKPSQKSFPDSAPNSDHKIIPRNSKLEEESDWNISSFDEDK